MSAARARPASAGGLPESGGRAERVRETRPGDGWPTRWTGAWSSALMKAARSSTNVSSVIFSSASKVPVALGAAAAQGDSPELAAEAGTWSSHSR